MTVARALATLLAERLRTVADWFVDPGWADDHVPERCPDCRERRPADPLAWERWEAEHELCEPVGVRLPW